MRRQGSSPPSPAAPGLHRRSCHSPLRSQWQRAGLQLLDDCCRSRRGAAREPTPQAEPRGHSSDATAPRTPSRSTRPTAGVDTPRSSSQHRHASTRRQAAATLAAVALRPEGRSRLWHRAGGAATTPTGRVRQRWRHRRVATAVSGALTHRGTRESGGPADRSQETVVIPRIPTARGAPTALRRPRSRHHVGAERYCRLAPPLRGSPIHRRTPARPRLHPRTPSVGDPVEHLDHAESILSVRPAACASRSASQEARASERRVSGTSTPSTSCWRSTPSSIHPRLA